VTPVVEKHLRTFLAWDDYEATPDYEAKPEPTHAPRITLVTPSL
jgi:lipoyl(octanoyl) transferase